MAKILNAAAGIKKAGKIRKAGQKIVLAGGCFDILHKGHIKFLRESKNYGEALFVLLESDENIKEKKGNGRPINNQLKRAQNLALLQFPDYIITLTRMTNDLDYDTLLTQINPEVITATQGDKELKHKKRQAKKLKARLVLIKKLEDYSTTKILEKYGTTRRNTLQH